MGPFSIWETHLLGNKVFDLIVIIIIIIMIIIIIKSMRWVCAGSIG